MSQTRIEKRAGVAVLVYETGCRPATDMEAEWYADLQRVRADLACEREARSAEQRGAENVARWYEEAKAGLAEWRQRCADMESNTVDAMTHLAVCEERDALRARLDALEQNLFRARLDGSIGRPPIWYLQPAWTKRFLDAMRGATFAEAIDAAMAANPNGIEQP